MEVHREIRDPGAEPPSAARARATLERRVAEETAYVRDDGGPVCFAGTRRRIGGGGTSGAATTRIGHAAPLQGV